MDVANHPAERLFDLGTQTGAAAASESGWLSGLVLQWLTDVVVGPDEIPFRKGYLMKTIVAALIISAAIVSGQVMDKPVGVPVTPIPTELLGAARINELQWRLTKTQIMLGQILKPQIQVAVLGFRVSSETAHIVWRVFASDKVTEQEMLGIGQTIVRMVSQNLPQIDQEMWCVQYERPGKGMVYYRDRKLINQLPKNRVMTIKPKMN